MKKILLTLVALIPGISPTFAKNTNISEEINYINKPKKNHFKIEFDPDPAAGATWDNPDHDGIATGKKEVILLKWSDMTPTLQDFYQLFPHITINFNLKSDMYASGDIHKDSYNKNGSFSGNTQDLFNLKSWVNTDLDMHHVFDGDRLLENVANSWMATLIDSDNIFHLTLNIIASIEGTCTSDCWEIEAVTSISSIIFSS